MGGSKWSNRGRSLSMAFLIVCSGCTPTFQYRPEQYQCPRTLLENVQKKLEELCPSPESSQPQRS